MTNKQIDRGIAKIKELAKICNLDEMGNVSAGALTTVLEAMKKPVTDTADWEIKSIRTELGVLKYSINNLWQDKVSKIELKQEALRGHEVTTYACPNCTISQERNKLKKKEKIILEIYKKYKNSGFDYEYNQCETKPVIEIWNTIKKYCREIE